MKINNDPMATPVYVKDAGLKWPSDKMFYLIAQEGVYRCRNHPFFTSCVPTKDGIKGLESQDDFLDLSYPKLPQALVERAVGFFRLVADKQNSEAAALWVWNKLTEQVELIVPEQTAHNSSSSKSHPHGYPGDVKYEIPALAPHQLLIGDIHSHVDGAAYSSGMDQGDETHRPGIHIVVGHIFDKNPVFHCEAVTDGKRFGVSDLDCVWEGFQQMDTASVPPEWVERVKLKVEKGFTWSGESGGSSGYGYTGGGGYGQFDKEIDENDQLIMKRILDKFAQEEKCPTFRVVQTALFAQTMQVAYLECERRANKFIEHWEQIKQGAKHEDLIGPK